MATPFGMQPTSKVFALKPGENLGRDGDTVVKTDKDGNIIERMGSIGNLPDSTSKMAAVQNSQTSISGDGYLTEYDVPSSDVIASFSTDWVVPKDPAQANKILFLWNGLISSDTKTFMQPVLEWNNGAPGWQIRNWVEINNIYYHGNAEPVQAGDQLTGIMTLQSATSAGYTYKISFAGYPELDYTATFASPANQLAEEWETRTDSQTDFPPQNYARMGNIKYLKYGSKVNQPVTWSIYSNGALSTPSGLNTVVNNNGTTNTSVDFYFQ